ncbi:MAG: pyruvate ferredoxin oxidoreductase [Prevotella sp.]|nr:pyruvate ferredoxin oxidoreductase [Prevotella sp.]
MDYRYIQQLMERYWSCETSLEEEEILRMFFSQKDVPAELLRYKDLFTYELREPRTDVLGDDFDERVISMIEEPAPVKARTITMTHRLMPLFKAAAVVAIILTLGNAAQVPFKQNADPISRYDGYERFDQGTSVAMSDSAVMDTIQQSSIQPKATNILK